MVDVLLAAVLLILLATTAGDGFSRFRANLSIVEEAFQSGGRLYGNGDESPAGAVNPIPGTGGEQVQFITQKAATQSQSEAADLSGQTVLQNFVEMVFNGETERLTGVFVPGVLALRVVQQPAGQPGYISTEEGAATQFGLSAKYGSIGLLAHNYLSGADFFNVLLGQEISLVYGDGRLSTFLVTSIRRFQALSPNSPYSNFLDLDNGNQPMTMQQVFDQTYGRASVLLLQTCIEAEGIQTWGRLFVIAVPVRD